MRKYYFIILLLVSFAIIQTIGAKDVNYQLLESGFANFLEERLECTAKKLEKNPDDIGLNILYSNLNWGLGRYEEAEKFARKALEISPTDIEALLNYSVILFSCGRYNEMLDVIKRCRKISPKNPAIFDLMAKYYNKLGNKDKELETLLGMVTFIEYPKSIPYGKHFFATYDKEGYHFFILSRKMLETIILSKIDDYQRLQDLYMSIDDKTSETQRCKLEEILHCLEKLNEKYPQILKIKIELAVILSVYKRFAEAKKILMDVINTSPEYLGAYIFIANILRKEKNYKLSLEFLDKAEEINPHPYIYFIKGEIYEELKRFAEAVMMYKTGLTIVRIHHEKYEYIPKSIKVESIDEKIRKLEEKIKKQSPFTIRRYPQAR